ncbi:MAG TPA: sigma-70 family RNA polymerase sigma factor [Kofleriaceae bacterium]|nr:sigma-70 family RNA polymerase sigma factor [Kofleriaceae bacterium]
MSDHGLVQRALAGDRAAFAALVERYQRLVVGVAFAITRDRMLAEDVGQDTFVAAWRQLVSLGDPARIGAWLAGIARNLANNAVRKRGRRRDPDRLDEPVSSPLDHVVERERRELLQRALDELPDAHREAIVLYYFEDRSVEQVAAGLGVTRDVVKQRLHRAREATRARLFEQLEAMRPSAAFSAGVIAAITIATVTEAKAATTSVATGVTKGQVMIGSKLALATLAVAVGGGVWYCVTRRDAEANTTSAETRADDGPHAIARRISPLERVSLAAAIVAARQAPATAQPAASTNPSAPPSPAVHPHCSGSPSECNSTYLQSTMTVVAQLLASCQDLHHHPAPVRVDATIETEPNAGAMFASVSVADVTGPTESVLASGGVAFLDADSERVVIAEPQPEGAATAADPSLANAPGSITIDPRAEPGTPISAELHDCIVDTMYSIELDPAELPGDLAWHLTLFGGQSLPPFPS